MLDKEGEILCKTYQLSNGNPIQDTIEVFEKLREQIETKGASLEVLGVGTTGYAKDILTDGSSMKKMRRNRQYNYAIDRH